MQLNNFSRQKTFFRPTYSRTQMQVLNVVARKTLISVLPFIIYSMSFVKRRCCCVLFVCSCTCACFCFTSFEWTFLDAFFGLTRRWSKRLKWRKPFCALILQWNSMCFIITLVLLKLSGHLLNSRCYRVHMQQHFHNQPFVYKQS